MPSHQLAGSRLLIVEDEYFLAEDARSVLSDVGAEVLGPVATVTAARAFIETDPDINGVLLDVNLRGEMAFDVADDLQTRGIPFAFVTGYDRAAFPSRFSTSETLEKPVDRKQLVDLLERLAANKQRQGAA